MKTRIALIALAMWVNVVATSAQTLLRWNLTSGIAYEVERVTTLKQTVEIQGKASTEERKSVWRVRLQSFEKRGEDFLVRATLSDVRHHLIGVAKEELLDLRLDERMKGAVFILRVTPSGRIIELTGYEDFLKRISDTQKTTNSTRTAFPEATLRDGFIDVLGSLPDKAVKPGDAWEREIVEPIPHFGTLYGKLKYTYNDDGENIARITATIATRYEQPKNESAVVFRVVQGTIETEKSSGRLEFDRKAGHVSRHERTTALQGKLVIEAANQRQTVGFSSVSESIITIARAKR